MIADQAPTPPPPPAPVDDGYGPVAGQPDGFNAVWYAHANPDVVAAKVDPLYHYMKFGKAEGRLPYEGAPAPAKPADTLPTLDLTGMALWNWNANWTAAEWGTGFTALPSKYDHVQQQPNGDVTFTLDAVGGATLQGENLMPALTRGRWEVDVTLPAMRDGVVVAPLWLYDPSTGDEIDFELPGRNGLDLTVHQNGGQIGVRTFAGRDFSGQRVRFGIEMDQAAGYVSMLVDGTEVHRFDRSAQFPTHGLKPYIDILPFDPNNGNFVNWCGKFAGMAAGDKLVMTVHGYRYTAI